MKRLALAFALALAASLALLPGAAGAHHRHHGFHGGFSAGCCVFIGPGHAFAPRPFGLHRHFFASPGFFPPSSTFIVVDPTAQPVWVWMPGSWWWNGAQWVWWPGHWTLSIQ